MTPVRRLFLPLSVLVLIWAAWTVELPLWGETPGVGLALDEQVQIQDAADPDLNGDFLLTVVNVRPLTSVGVVEAIVDREEDVIRASELLPRGVDPEAYFRQQRELFQLSADVAAAVALRAAGEPVDPTAVVGDGALVIDVVRGAPADGVLLAGDVVVAVDGAAISTAEELGAAITSSPQDAAVEVRFRRDDREETATITPHRDEDGRRRIGVVADTAGARVPLPTDVRVESGRIGGPSAGLLVALTVYDKVSPVDLAHGRLIAGTGGLEPDGQVTGVGGVRLKAIAAARAGADVFLAPAHQAEAARAGVPSGSGMTVIAVARFDDAVAALTQP